MTQQTVSEKLFERFCLDIRLPSTPVPRANGKTPDFELCLNGNRVVTELKQLDPNDNDKHFFDLVRRTGTASGSSASDNRIRRKIYESNAQLKARSNGRLPALVVLYDNGTLGGIDEIDIKTAMFGDEKVVISLINHEVHKVTPIRRGGGRQMTAEWNTTISAVGLLWGSPDSIMLSVFHNHFAVNPIDPDWIRHERVRHLKLASGCYEWTTV